MANIPLPVVACDFGERSSSTSYAASINFANSLMVTGSPLPTLIASCSRERAVIENDQSIGFDDLLIISRYRTPLLIHIESQLDDCCVVGLSGKNKYCNT